MGWWMFWLFLLIMFWMWVNVRIRVWRMWCVFCGICFIVFMMRCCCLCCSGWRVVVVGIWWGCCWERLWVVLCCRVGGCVSCFLLLMCLFLWRCLRILRVLSGCGVFRLWGCIIGCCSVVSLIGI